MRGAIVALVGIAMLFLTAYFELRTGGVAAVFVMGCGIGMWLEA